MDKCPDCGATGNHPNYGPHYWPCGSMRHAAIRGDACYQAEIGRLEKQIDTFKQKKQLPAIHLAIGLIATMADFLGSELGRTKEEMLGLLTNAVLEFWHPKMEKEKAE